MLLSLGARYDLLDILSLSPNALLKSEEDKKLLLKMLNDCQKYALAINAKETPFLTESLIMALMLAQHKMIDWLSRPVLLQKFKPVNPKVEPQEGFNDSSFVMK
jgi:hypothetical protein